MKVLVFGATGKTGGLVVDSALARGHEVTVLARNAGKYNKPGVRVLAGDATNSSDVLKAVEGQSAIIDTIGGTTPYKATQLERTAAKNIIDAMRTQSVRRLVVVSMMGLGDSSTQAPFWYRNILMKTFLRGSSPDKAAMEDLVRSSGLDYVIARPPILKDEPATGRVKVLTGNTIGHAITRADLANFLTDQLTTDVNLGRSVTIVNT